MNGFVQIVLRFASRPDREGTQLYNGNSPIQSGAVYCPIDRRLILEPLTSCWDSHLRYGWQYNRDADGPLFCRHSNCISDLRYDEEERTSVNCRVCPRRPADLRGP